MRSTGSIRKTLHTPRSVALAKTLLVAIGLLAASMLDGWIWAFTRIDDPLGIRLSDWYQFYRQMGYVPLYVVLAGAMALYELAACRPWTSTLYCFRRGALLVAGVLLAGGAGELLKLTIGRMRPAGIGIYRFKPALEGFTDGSNLGMPSSHAVVAFAGAFMLGRIFPGVRPLLLALATGCAALRVCVSAHFASDVYMGAVLAYLVVEAVWIVDRRLHGAEACWTPVERPRILSAPEGTR